MPSSVEDLCQMSKMLLCDWHSGVDLRIMFLLSHFLMVVNTYQLKNSDLKRGGAEI